MIRDILWPHDDKISVMAFWHSSWPALTFFTSFFSWRMGTSIGRYHIIHSMTVHFENWWHGQGKLMLPRPMTNPPCQGKKWMWAWMTCAYFFFFYQSHMVISNTLVGEERHTVRIDTLLWERGSVLPRPLLKGLCQGKLMLAIPRPNDAPLLEGEEAVILLPKKWLVTREHHVGTVVFFRWHLLVISPFILFLWFCCEIAESLYHLE